jgi:hypothetical protein
MSCGFSHDRYPPRRGARVVHIERRQGVRPARSRLSRSGRHLDGRRPENRCRDRPARAAGALRALRARSPPAAACGRCRCRCRAIRLGEGSEFGHWVSAKEMAAAEARVRAGVERMRHLLVDPAANAPRARAHFRLAENQAICWTGGMTTNLFRAYLASSDLAGRAFGVSY